MKNIIKQWSTEQDFTLKHGGNIDALVIAYRTYYVPKREKSNLIWGYHSLTEDSSLFNWWSNLIRKDKLVNPNDYFIICTNDLSSCDGNTDQLNFNNELNKYYSHFPLLTRAMAKAYNSLNIEYIYLINEISFARKQDLRGDIIVPSIFRNEVFKAPNAEYSTRVITIDYDALFSPTKQIFLANHINGVNFVQINSKYSHDCFLIEVEPLESLIKDFLFNNFNKNKITTLKKVAA